MDFLTPGIREIRKSIIDIDDSYNNDWDILAELCQNSVDAIRSGQPDHPKITIEINCIQKSISIQDNGVGIDPEMLPDLLGPFSTNKEKDDSSIGEKGVGLTFVLFSCNKFTITSGTEKGSRVGRIDDALNWKMSSNHENVSLELSEPSSHFLGTKVELNRIGDIPLFNLSSSQVIHLLRTRTAIGNSFSLWDNNDNMLIGVELKHTNLDNIVTISTIPNKYWMIYESLDSNSKIDLNEFIDYAKDANRTDQEKRRKLMDKLIYKKGEFLHLGRTIKYVTCFVPKRRVWDDLSIRLDLCTSENLEDSDWIDKFGYTKFNSGIYTSVKGMPTGISVQHPNTGFAGYWSNIFILFEDRHLKFDIGRKSIHGRIANIYRKYAKEIFNNYLKYITKYVSGEIVAYSDWNKDEIFSEIDSIIDLNNPRTKFMKTPKDQEAAVAAIFYECIGSGHIKDIIPLTSGYRNKYDLYAKWGNRNIVIEFKSKLRNILKDFTDEQKLFNEIDVIVCWNITEDDVQAMSNKGITLEEISTSSLSIGIQQQVPNATHLLILSGLTGPIYIIDLRIILNR